LAQEDVAAAFEPLDEPELDELELDDEEGDDDDELDDEEPFDDPFDELLEEPFDDPFVAPAEELASDLPESDLLSDDESFAFSELVAPARESLR